VDATYVGNGVLEIGTTEVRLDISGAQALSKQFIVGTHQQIADFIVEAVQAANPGLTPLHTMRGGQFTGEVHLGDPAGPPTHTLDTSGTPALRQRGEPGLIDPDAIAVPFTPDQNFTAQQMAGAIAQAVNQANSQGFDVTASVANNVVVLSGSNFQFSPGSTALTTDLVIPIPFTASQSAEQVAAAISAAIANTQLNVSTHLVGNRINLENLSPANPLAVNQTPGAGSAVPGVTLEGQAGATTGVPIPIHSEMSAAQVRDAVAAALNRTFAPAADQMGINTFSVHANVVRIQGHTITNAGPLGATSLATAPGNSSLPGDSVGAFNNSNPALRGQNNRFEGVYVDDIIIGFAERGEMATGPNRGDDSFVHVGSSGTVGAYQLEIRRASEYGSGQLNILRSFDTNDRLSQDVTLFASPGSQINPTATFTISDGVDSVVFEYVNANVPGAEPQPGNVPIFFSPSDSAAEVANKIRDVINSQQVQQNRRLNVQAASNDSSDRVDLVGETVKVNLIKPGLTIDGITTNANDLRNAILGSGAIPVGNAQFLGGAFSAGFFSGGTSSIGIESGIVLSTGDVRFAEGPNADDGSSAQSSAVGDADLDAEFGVVTEDTTVLEFNFQLDDVVSRDLFFNFVFASEEYNEFVNTQFNDVFAFFVDGQNIAFVPGTTDPVSINTVNGGNPFGTAANNPQAYNNNDPNENGQFLNRFGLDGFTNVFTAVARDLAPGVHTIKLAISDVGDEILDSAVFIEAGSFGSAAPQERIRNGIVGIRHNEIGDKNRVRDQGQLILSNNFITNSSTFGIVVESGDSVPRNLEQLNQDRLAPGVVIVNNVFARNAEGGLRFAGNASPQAAVPFGRIVNNTFFGIPNVASTTLTTIVNDNNDFFSVDPQTLAVTHLGSVNRVFTDIAVSSGRATMFAIDGQSVSTSSLFNVAVDVANPGGPLAVTTLGSLQAGHRRQRPPERPGVPSRRTAARGRRIDRLRDRSGDAHRDPLRAARDRRLRRRHRLRPERQLLRFHGQRGAVLDRRHATGQGQSVGTLPNNDFFGFDLLAAEPCSSASAPGARSTRSIPPTPRSRSWGRSPIRS
jgi:hypothetical protein